MSSPKAWAGVSNYSLTNNYIFFHTTVEEERVRTEKLIFRDQFWRLNNLSWSLISNVEGYREDEALRVVVVVLHGALVPHLVSRLVVHLAEVSEERKDIREKKYFGSKPFTKLFQIEKIYLLGLLQF